MVKASVWGCAWKYYEEEKIQGIISRAIHIDNLMVGVECRRTIESIDPYKTKRTVLLALGLPTKNGLGEWPIWITFESPEELEETIKLLQKALEAFKKDKDYEGGYVPTKWEVV